MSQPIDLLIEPRWLIPIEPHGVVLEGQAVAAAGPGGATALSSRKTRRPARTCADPGPGQFAHARRHDVAARHRRRPGAHGLAEDTHLAGRSQACLRRLRARRHAARLRRDAARRHHLLQRHVLLPRGGGGSGAQSRHARRARHGHHRIPHRLCHGCRRLPQQGTGCPGPPARRPADLVLHGAACALYRQRCHPGARRHARRPAGPADPHSHP